MEVRIRHGQGQQATAFARFHRVVCDQPFDEGGMEGGMTPPELMLSAVGCCAMGHAGEYLRARGRPVRLTEIGIEVDAPGLSSHMRDGLIKAIEACLLCRTLQDPPVLNIRMATPLAEGAVSVALRS
jgi:putative redox protein